MFDITFPDGIRRGMAFDSPTHPKVFVTKNGSAIVRKDWKKLKQLAVDDLPESIRVPRTPSASDDAEHRIGMLRHTLRGYGLADDSIDEACEICRRELAGEVTDDELPTSGPGGARNAANSRSREPDEKAFRSPGRFESRSPLGTTSSSKERSMLGEATYRASPASDASFLEEFPEAARIKAFPEPPEDSRPLTRAERRHAYALAMDAADGTAEARLLEMFGPDGPARIKIGDFPRRGR
jgi:hypothetical protein